MKKIVSKIEKELKVNIDPVYKDGATRYFKEEVWILGVRLPIVRKISAKYFKEIKDLDKKEIFELCEELLQKENEFKTVAFSWLYRIQDRYEEKDFPVFEKYLKKYVTDWGSCDDFCTHAFGNLVYQYPNLLSNIKIWAKSKNRWLRRASAVILIHPISRKKYLKEIFGIADILFLDEDDLVQKGYGWMLKVASNTYQKEVFDYVMRNKSSMPRTALRYAIEKMPSDLKKKAMAR